MVTICADGVTVTLLRTLAGALPTRPADGKAPGATAEDEGTDRVDP
jgi:hypothetical protein